MFRYFSIYFLLSLVGAVQGATVNLTADETSVTEGQSFTLRVSLDEDTLNEDLTGKSALVSLTIEGNENDDLRFSIPLSQQLIAVNSSTKQLYLFIDALKDDLAEETETFTFKIGIIPSGDVKLGQNRLEISVRDQEVGQFNFKSSSFSVKENAGNAIITVERVNGSDGIATVNYATTTTGTAIPGTDYQEATGRLTWLDGETDDKTFSVSIIDNAAIDGDKTVGLILFDDQSPQNPSEPSAAAIIGLSEATLTIEDDDPTAPSGLTIEPKSFTLKVGNSIQFIISGVSTAATIDDAISTDENVARVSDAETLPSGFVVTVETIRTGIATIRITDPFSDESVEARVRVTVCEPNGCFEDKPCLCFDREPNSDPNPIIDVGVPLTLNLNLIDIQDQDNAALYVAFALPDGYMIPLIFLSEQIGFVTEMLPFKENIKQADNPLIPILDFNVEQCLGGTYTYYAGLFFPETDELASNLAVGKVTLEDICN